MKKLILVGLILSFVSATVVAQKPASSPEPSRYKVITGELKQAHTDFIDPLTLPAAITQVLSGVLFFGGSTLTSKAKGMYSIYGWIAIGAGLILASTFITAIDGRSQVQISSVDGGGPILLDTKKMLASIESDSLLISENLGAVQIVDDLASSAKMSAKEIASLILKSKAYANSLTHGRTIAENRVLVDAKIVKASLNLQTNDEAAMVFNYLALRNIQVKNI